MSTEITEAAVISVDKFPQFDIVSDASDHHYVGKTPKSSLSKTGPVQKKIMQEWKLLSRELPDSIFVRAYETRVDLLRAAIIGARGTPYHDGLFFFDICFPFDYPGRPPSVYYWSFGYRINPNLYGNGRVCLSLLNTWIGDKCEKWDPNNSTILQVLLSIQALVLNEKPYFNEPIHVPFSKNRTREKKSLAYSEDAFVLSCKTMLWVLSRPLKNFEPLVKQHFMERAEFILDACDMYRKGFVGVGSFDGVVKKGGTKGTTVSKRFESSIDKVFKDLVRAFARNGATASSISESLERIEKMENEAKEEKKEKEKEKEKQEKKKKKKGKVGVGVVGKLWNIFVGLVMVKKETKTSPFVEVHN